MRPGGVPGYISSGHFYGSFRKLRALCQPPASPHTHLCVTVHNGGLDCSRCVPDGSHTFAGQLSPVRGHGAKVLLADASARGILPVVRQSRDGWTLHALEILEDSPIQIVSSCIPTTEDRMDNLLHVLKEDVTPVLNQHHSMISNLSSMLPSGGVATETTQVVTNQVVTDDDSTGSTNTGSTTGSIASYAALNRLNSHWNNMDFWKAGRGN